MDPQEIKPISSGKVLPPRQTWEVSVKVSRMLYIFSDGVTIKEPSCEKHAEEWRSVCDVCNYPIISNNRTNCQFLGQECTEQDLSETLKECGRET